MGLNEDLFRALNGAGNPVLDPVMVALGVLGLLAFFLLWAVPLGLARRGREAVDLVVLLVAAEAIVFVLKVAFRVARPTVGTTLGVPFDDVSDPSFPSGHATRAFAAALLLMVRTKDWRWGVPLLAYATLIAVSRVYVGVHWPSDVFAGAVLGLGLAYALERLSRLPVYSGPRDRFLERIASLRRQKPA